MDRPLHRPGAATDAGRFLSRRRLAMLAGGVAAAAALRPARLAARQTPNTPAAATQTAATPTATPVAADAPPDAAGFPLPSTLAADASPAFRAVAEALVGAMRRYGIPGTALGVLAGDREEHATFGVASLNTLEPVGPETLFQIGSLTKTFTATAVWRLIDAGVLALHAPVRTYLPGFRVQDEAASAAVTVGNLLDHTAGWYGDEGWNSGDGDDAVARYVAERMPQLPQSFPVGEHVSYNNAAFQLLGRLVEVATGTTYDAALENLLLGPLGLPDSLLAHGEVLHRPFADGHYAGPINGRDALAVQTPLWVPRGVNPAGGLWSTTRDLVRYARFHLDPGLVAGGANVVSPESLLRMREPVMPLPAADLSIGRNWFLQEADEVRAFTHNGTTISQHAVFLAIPERRFAFVMLTNSNSGAVADAEVTAAALASYPGLSALSGRLGMAAAEAVPPDAPTVDLPAATLAEYAGRYADPGQVHSFVATDGGLEWTVEPIQQSGAWLPAILPPTPQPPVPVAFLRPDAAVAGGSDRLSFVRDASGRVGWVASGVRMVPRADPT